MSSSIFSPKVPNSLQKSLDSSKVEYVQLGRSGLRVSMPVLGVMGLGSNKMAPWAIDEEESLEILKDAWERGITTWDTANAYSNGASEEVIGKALRKFNIPRHKVNILTKCFLCVGEEPGMIAMLHLDKIAQSKDYVNQYGLSRAAIFNAVEASLRRLDTDYIDLLQIHRFDPTVPPEETMKALHDLVQSGKVRYIGASSMWTYQFAMLQFVAEQKGWTKLVSMQNRYNLLYREEEREMNKFCKETGVGLIPWSPLSEGKLARAPGAETERTKIGSPHEPTTSEADHVIIGRVQELAERKGWTMAQVALSWVKHRGPIPILGVTNMKRMREASDIRGKTLTEEEAQYLEAPYVPKNVIGHR